MVAASLIISKAGVIRHHRRRIAEQIETDAKRFIKDYDVQDIVAFNLQLAAFNAALIL